MQAVVVVVLIQGLLVLVELAGAVLVAALVAATALRALRILAAVAAVQAAQRAVMEQAMEVLAL